MSDSTRHVERNLETKEGTAHLGRISRRDGSVGARPGGNEGCGRVDTRAGSSEVLAETSEAATTAGVPTEQAQPLGLILADLGASWQTKVAAGAALDVLLNRAARIPASGSLRTAARAQFVYNEPLQTAERNARSAIGDPIAAFFALEAYRITIEIGGIPGVQPSLSFSPGIAGIVRPAPSLSIVNRAERASMTNPGFDVSIKGRPVMIDGRTAPRHTFVVLLPSPVKLNGARATDVRASDPAVICQVVRRRHRDRAARFSAGINRSYR